jgi:hypothetical protein
MGRREVRVRMAVDADMQGLQGIGGSSWSVEGEQTRTSPQR